jgi:hypothetical protein
VQMVVVAVPVGYQSGLVSRRPLAVSGVAARVLKARRFDGLGEVLVPRHPSTEA